MRYGRAGRCTDIHTRPFSNHRPTMAEPPVYTRMFEIFLTFVWRSRSVADLAADLLMVGASSVVNGVTQSLSLSRSAQEKTPLATARRRLSKRRLTQESIYLSDDNSCFIVPSWLSRVATPLSPLVTGLRAPAVSGRNTGPQERQSGTPSVWKMQCWARALGIPARCSLDRIVTSCASDRLDVVFPTSILWSSPAGVGVGWNNACNHWHTHMYYSTTGLILLRPYTVAPTTCPATRVLITLAASLPGCHKPHTVPMYPST
ncbi:hypothetical protein Bbelb_140790 [Branchiostoma belcheri]|nr:hypothetical protein Bbelb_140790 [Branchiostoma belcheri]